MNNIEMMNNLSKRLVSIFSLAVVVLGSCFLAQAQVAKKKHGLLPVPRKIVWQDGSFRIGDRFDVAVKGSSKNERFGRYLERTITRLEQRTLKRFPRTSSDAAAANVIITIENAEEKYPRLGNDESYVLSVTANRITLNAKTGIGAMRGQETLLQLLSADKDGFYFPAVKINDQPRFPWRGLLIDVARHYQPMHVIKRNIDGMAAVKMNVLHWHLTEDQGFRAESKKFPKLHGLGSDGLFYSQEEMKEIVEYAADRGIRVMPEFDIPGHATAWLVGHPEIGSQPGPYVIERDPGIFDPTLNPIKEETYELLDTLLTEMSEIFPDKYFHIGGDENEGKHWDANPEIQKFMKEKGIKDNHELQTFFNKRVLKILERNQKTMMGWDEIFQPDLPKAVVIHSWRGQKALSDAAKTGYQGVLSNGYYIDLLHPASQHYLVDPLPDGNTLSDEQRARVLGGEATMWGEWVTPETIDSRIWMRTAAISERFWSSSDVRDVEDMYRRLEILSTQLEEHGLTHRTYRAKLLRRLAPGHDIDPLIELLELIEPVKGYRRYQILKQTMLHPLTGLIDASSADAKNARRFNTAVEKLFSSGQKESIEKLKAQAMSWKTLSKELEPIFLTSPGLHKANDIPDQLNQLSEITIDALTHIEKKTKGSETWKKDCAEKIAKMKASKAAIEFAMISGVERLVGLEKAKK